MWHCLRLGVAGRHLGSGLVRRAVFSTSPASSSFYDSTIEKYAFAPLQKMNLDEVTANKRAALQNDDYLLQHARFVQTELPKRLARRLLDLRFLPHIVITNPHIRRVYDAYYKALGILLPLPEIRTIEQNVEFTEILKNLLDEQTHLLDDLAAGLRECLIKKSITDRVNLQPFVEGILRSRISRRVMAQHHIGLHDRKEGFTGCICHDLNVHAALEDAATHAQDVCRQVYGSAPKVRVEADRPVSMTYIPAHLDYMLFELLKNSMKALMEHPTGSIPDIRAMICESPSTVTIKFSDQGGGIDPEHLEHVWQYGYSTTHNHNGASQSKTTLSSLWLNTQHTSRSNLSGFGFGLPFTRLHARYFGGDLQLVSVPGFGVDVFLTTKKLNREAMSETVEIEHLERLEYKAVEINRTA